MQIGCHGLVWTGSNDPESFEEAVTKTLAAGFDLFEMALFDPETFDVGAAREILAKHPVAVSASMGQARDSDPNSEDPAKVRAAEKKLIAAIDVLEALGSTYFVGALYSELRKFMAPATATARANAVGVIRTAADRAADAGITLGMEVINRYETNLFNTGRGALKFLDEVDRPNVGVHLDTYHMNIEESDMVQPVEDCIDRLVYVHVGESHRGYLGSGNVDFDNFFKALVRSGYDGPVTFESFSSAVVHPELSGMLGIWRNLWDDSEDLGAHANAFIRGQLRAAQTIGMH